MHVVKHALVFLLLVVSSTAYNAELDTTPSFQGPGIPTLAYGGARLYAQQNNTFVTFIKMRYGCADDAVDALNDGSMRVGYAELGMPIVAGAIRGFMWSADPSEEIPAFFKDVITTYFNGDAPYDFLIEDQSDEDQTAVDFKPGGSFNYDKHGRELSPSYQFKIATGAKRSEFESKYGLKLEDICRDPKMSLYNRDDTGYLCKRKWFWPYESGTGFSSHLKSEKWKYTSRPRKVAYSQDAEGYAHGLIDSTGTSTGYNYLLHIASPWTTTKVAYTGPDNDRTLVKYVKYYDNLQDWYKLTNLETNKYYSIAVSELCDPESVGTVFVFHDAQSAEYATNEVECLSRCQSSFRMTDAQNGVSFPSGTNTSIMVCFQLCGSSYISYNNGDSETIDQTKNNQVVKYKWFLKSSDAPAPTPVQEEVTTPQYNTNVFEIARLTDLVFEGGWEYGGYDTKITRHSPAIGQLTIHMTWDKIERGYCQWADGVTGEQTMTYEFPYDPAFNADRRIDVCYENFFMKLMRSLVVRDRLVKYMAQEHYSDATHNYDKSGLDMFPVTGMWFVDNDDILRCVDDPASTTVSGTEGSTLVLDLQASKSGTVSIGSVNGGKAELFSVNGASTVVQTNFYPLVENQNKMYSRMIVHKSKKNLGSRISESIDIKPMETFKTNLTENSVIRISFPSGSKIYEFDFVN